MSTATKLVLFGAAPFNPLTSIPGVIFSLDAGKLTLAEGASCQTFTNQKPGGTSPTQATPSKQPVFHLDSLMGAYLTFDGSTQYLRVATPALTPPFTWFLLARLRGDPTTNTSFFDAGSANNKYNLNMTGNTWGQFQIYGGANLQIGAWGHELFQLYWGIANTTASRFVCDRQITTTAGIPDESGTMGATVNGAGITLAANGVATPSATSFCPCDISQFHAYTGILTTAQINAMLAYLRKKLPTPVILVGDSITYGSTAATKQAMWGTVFCDHWTQPLTGTNLGVGGKRITEMNTDAAAQIAAYSVANRPLQTVTIFGGTNDFQGGYSDVDAVMAAHIALCNKWRAVSNYVIDCTMLPRDGMETQRTDYNDRIRTFVAATPGMYLADLAADPDIGQAGQNHDTTYYNADTVHLTSAGHAKIATVVIAACNWLT